MLLFGFILILRFWSLQILGQMLGRIRPIASIQSMSYSTAVKEVHLFSLFFFFWILCSCLDHLIFCFSLVEDICHMIMLIEMSIICQKKILFVDKFWPQMLLIIVWRLIRVYISLETQHCWYYKLNQLFKIQKLRRLNRAVSWCLISLSLFFLLLESRTKVTFAVKFLTIRVLSF